MCHFLELFHGGVLSDKFLWKLMQLLVFGLAKVEPIALLPLLLRFQLTLTEISTVLMVTKMMPIKCLCCLRPILSTHGWQSVRHMGKVGGDLQCISVGDTKSKGNFLILEPAHVRLKGLFLMTGISQK